MSNLFSSNFTIDLESCKEFRYANLTFIFHHPVDYFYSDDLFAGLSASTVSIQFGLAIIIQCVSIVLGAGVLVILSIIYDACNRSISFFSNPWILFGIYYCPLMFCLGLGCALHVTFYKKVWLFVNQTFCYSLGLNERPTSYRKKSILNSMYSCICTPTAYF